MKRFLVAVLVFGLVAASLSAPALAGKKKKKKKPKRVERTAESSYQAPALGSGAGVCLVATNSCGDIPVGSEERFVSVEIVDASGLAVFATVGQDLDGDGFTDTSTAICGKSEEPIQVEPGYPLTIFPWAVGGPDCPAVATQGTVTVTLSNLP